MNLMENGEAKLRNLARSTNSHDQKNRQQN
jgi:hypothetical protein